MHCLDGQGHEDSHIGLHQRKLANRASLRHHGPSVINPDTLKYRSRGQTIDGKLAKYLRLRLGREATTNNTHLSNGSNDSTAPNEVKLTTQKGINKSRTSM